MDTDDEKNHDGENIMSRGDPQKTDLISIKKISQYDRPLALKELADLLNWNPGKVDGSIQRLLSQGKIVTVKIVPPKGHRQRWVGLPNRKNSWKTFFDKKVTKEKNIIVSDPFNIFDGFNHQSSPSPTSDSTILALENEIRDLKIHLDKLRKYKNLDPDILQVIHEFQPQINITAKKLGITKSSELVQTILKEGLDENTPFFKELIKIFTEVWEKTKNPILRDMIFQAQQAIRTD